MHALSETSPNGSLQENEWQFSGEENNLIKGEMMISALTTFKERVFITADTLLDRHDYAIMDKYGIIGKPLGHSFSPDFFNQKFKCENIDAVYKKYELPQIDALNEVLDSNPELRGLNVTIPYKQAVMNYLDEISEEAYAIGAVNVVRITHSGNKIHTKGFNSDVIGFTRSIEPLLEKHHKKALILGTGGASHAIEYGLRKLGLDAIKVSRSAKHGTILYENITPDVVHEYNVIVNCTPVGMYPHTEDCPQLPYSALDNHNLLYDLIYNPDETMFMKKGKSVGAVVKNGLEMLLLQAYASWEFWHSTD